jgi:hypothetical protein
MQSQACIFGTPIPFQSFPGMFRWVHPPHQMAEKRMRISIGKFWLCKFLRLKSKVKPRLNGKSVTSAFAK